MRSSLTIHELEVFLELAEHRNFRVAAERSLVSQPAVSRTLQSAEWKLGVKLFDRNTSKVELTAAGKELLPIARKIISEFRHSLSDLSEFVAGRSGRVTVAALPSTAAAILPKALAAFQDSHPRVRVAVQPLPTDLVQSMVTDGSVDIGLSSPPAGRPDLLYERLIQDEFVLVCHRDSRLARSKTAKWEVFTRHPFVASGSSTSVRQITDRVLSETGVAVEPRYESSHLGVLGAMVAAKLGITAIPRLTLRLLDMSELAVVPLTGPAVVREVGLLKRQGRSLSAASSYFVEAVRSVANAIG